MGTIEADMRGEVVSPWSFDVCGARSQIPSPEDLPKAPGQGNISFERGIRSCTAAMVGRRDEVGCCYEQQTA